MNGFNTNINLRIVKYEFLLCIVISDLLKLGELGGRYDAVGFDRTIRPTVITVIKTATETATPNTAGSIWFINSYVDAENGLQRSLVPRERMPR